MQSNRPRDTKPEIALRSALHKAGMRFFKHRRPVPSLRCEADVVFPGPKVAVFLDGCFWHSCPAHGSLPASSAEWWAAKLQATKVRDQRNDEALREAGWLVMRAWEHEPIAEIVERTFLAVRSRSALQTITTVDLFAGAGGLTLGFDLADLGYVPTFAVEHEQAAARTFKANFGCEVFDGDIELVTGYPEADLVIGGPPCQGFSPLGRDRDDVSRTHLNELWQHYLEAVRRVRPKAFVIENVPEFQRSVQFAQLLDIMATDPVMSRYQLAYGVLNAADYGVPQRRRRGIFVAVDRKTPLPWPPPPTHGPESESGLPYVTVRAAIGDLPVRTNGHDVSFDIDGRQNLHFGRRPRLSSLDRYRAVPEGGNRFDLARNRPDLLPACWARKPTGTTDVMGRLWWDRPALTIRTEFFKPEKGRYLHPEGDRPITHREAARLQSFPDTFVFEGSKLEIARQIGNAVPPLLAKAIAEYVHRHAFANGRPD